MRERGENQREGGRMKKKGERERERESERARDERARKQERGEMLKGKGSEGKGRRPVLSSVSSRILNAEPLRSG